MIANENEDSKNNIASNPWLKKVSIDLNNVTLEYALGEIEKFGKLKLNYNKSQIPVSQKITVKMEDKTLYSVLQNILSETNTKLSVIQGQQYAIVPEKELKCKIIGKVIDKKTGQSMHNVNVTIKGTPFGTTTDEQGKFYLENLKAGNYTLMFDYIGYTQNSISKVVVDNGETKNLPVIEMEEQALMLKEIVVTPGTFAIMGDQPVAMQTLSREYIQNISWGEDVNRAIVRLPGIASNDFSAKFTVRGGESDQILVQLDGMQLYEPFHQKDFLGGLLSTVDIGTIDGIDLLTGGFGAEYGDRMSAIFNMQSRKVPDDTVNMSLGVSMMTLRLFSEGRFNNNKGSWMLSARRGYLDYVLALVNDQDEEISPAYYDILGKFEYYLNDYHIFSAYILHAGDKLTFRDNKEFERDDAYTKYGNSYLWLTLNSYLSSRIMARTILYSGAVTHNRTGNFKDEETDITENTLRDNKDFYLYGLKQDWNYELHDRIFLKCGFDFKRLEAKYDYYNTFFDERINEDDSLYIDNGSTRVNKKYDGDQASIYLASKVQLLAPLTVETGIRYDYVSYSNDRLLSPRINLAYALSKRTFIRSGWGYFYQSQGIHELPAEYGETKFQSAQLAKHYVLGFEHFFKTGLNFRIEAYYKDLSNLQPSYRLLNNTINFFPELMDINAKITLDGAKSKGIEFFLKYDMGKKISWWTSYAFAYTEDDITSIDFSGPLKWSGGTYPGANDQRHTFCLDVNYRPNNKWYFNIAWQCHSGWPYTTFHFERQTREDGTDAFYEVYDEFYGKRYPLYHRLDLKINKHFDLFGGRFTTIFEIINLYNRKNIMAVDYDIVEQNDGTYKVVRDDQTWFGILPALGISYEF